MENIELQEKTAIQNEQQSRIKGEIINAIIDIFVRNEMVIADAKEILRQTSNMLERQKVSNTSFGWIDAANIK